MAKGLSLSIGADTKAAVKGLEDIGDSLEGLQDELGETVKDSATLERKFSDDMRDISAAAEKTGRNVGSEISDGTRKASKGMDDFKQESKQAMRETAASITDVSDGLSVVQEIAANAFVGFGPAAVVGGIAAAVGIGLVTEGLITAQESADELKRRIASAFQAATEEGRNFLSEAQIQAEVLSIMFGEDQGPFKQAKKDAAELGVEVTTVLAAMAGDQDALNTVLERTNTLHTDAKTELDGISVKYGDNFAKATENLQVATDINTRYEQQKTLLDENSAKAQEYLDRNTANNEVVQRTNKSLAETPKTVPVALTVDDSQLRAALEMNRTMRVEVQLTRNGTAVY